MKKMTLWIVTVFLALGASGAAFAEEAAATPEAAKAVLQSLETAQAPDPTPAKEAEGAVLPQDPSLDFVFMACTAVCTRFYAPNPADCSEESCYAHHCGYPNGYAGNGTCSCSFCF
jgi:hypothetical protein